MLSDRLRYGDAVRLWEHLSSDAGYPQLLVRFIENHEESWVYVIFSYDHCKAAAGLAPIIPGLLLLYEGRLEDHSLKLPVHLGHRKEERSVKGLASFYRRLLGIF